jgi:ABC-2 type transport system ATP-binding protein
MIITAENLVKTYKTYKRGSGFRESVKSFFHREAVIVKAVDGISFEIPEGEIVGLLGPNGAGKSTAIKMLCGALYPTSGSINAVGFSPARDRKEYVFEIGAVFGQKSQLIWDIPPEDSFNLNRAISGISKSDYETRLKEMTELFDVGDVIKKPTRVLSLGERMKCEFIMAMLHNPKIVFLDEPTIGLDVIAKAGIRSFITEKNKQGTTYILTNHDLEDVRELADRVMIINKGVKVFDGLLSDLQNSMGRKKIIEVTLEKPLTAEAESKFNIIEKISDCQITIEADTEGFPISYYISELSEQAGFTDISIKELPMDRIITKIYQTEDRGEKTEARATKKI